METTARVFKFEAIGTNWSIDVSTRISVSEYKLLKTDILTCVEDFDVTYSRFRSDSLITRIAKKAGSYGFPDNAQLLFSFYWDLYVASAQKVTPLVGDLMVATGYDADYSFEEADNIQPVKKWEDVMNYVHPVLTTNGPVTLDFGAAGKGYLIDLIGEILEQRGVHDYCIDGSGDFLFNSVHSPSTSIGLSNPNDPSEAIGIAYINNGSICGSSGAFRAWGNRHHIMDPDTTESVREIIATWVIAKTALVADGIATALFFTDPTRLKQQFGFEYLILGSDMQASQSAGFGATLFSGVGH